MFRSCRANQLTYLHHSWPGLILLVVNQYFVHILLPITDNCSSWISRRGRFELGLNDICFNSNRWTTQIHRYRIWGSERKPTAYRVPFRTYNPWIYNQTRYRLRYGARLISDLTDAWKQIFFILFFTALSRISHLYRADRSSKVGENRRTRGKTTWPSVSRTWLSHICDPSEARTPTVRNLMD